jgi:hypothetical protein
MKSARQRHVIEMRVLRQVENESIATCKESSVQIPSGQFGIFHRRDRLRAVSPLPAVDRRFAGDTLIV